jgi:hypothetical protein
MVCKKCHTIEKHCRCPVKDLELVHTEREYKEPAKPQVKPVEKFLNDNPEFKEICPECKTLKVHCICQKVKRNDEIKRILSMDEEDLEAEEKKKSELDKQVEERNNQAIQNVEAIMKAKEQMKGEGKNPEEIKKAVKEMKKKQQKQPVIESPMKCTKCGVFYPGAEEHTCKES